MRCPNCKIALPETGPNSQQCPCCDWRPDHATLAETLDALKTLCDYAYQQGYHEMGYDPVEEVKHYLAEKDRQIESLNKDLEAGIDEKSFFNW
jgi:hypothetical protein